MSLQSPKSMNRREAAAYLSISEAFLKKLDLLGRGPSAIRIGRRWTYLQRDLDAFREAHRTPAPAVINQSITHAEAVQMHH